MLLRLFGARVIYSRKVLQSILKRISHAIHPATVVDISPSVPFYFSWWRQSWVKFLNLGTTFPVRIFLNRRWWFCHRELSWGRNYHINTRSLPQWPVLICLPRGLFLQPTRISLLPQLPKAQKLSFYQGKEHQMKCKRYGGNKEMYWVIQTPEEKLHNLCAERTIKSWNLSRSGQILFQSTERFFSHILIGTNCETSCKPVCFVVSLRIVLEEKKKKIVWGTNGIVVFLHTRLSFFLERRCWKKTPICCTFEDLHENTPMPNPSTGKRRRYSHKELPTVEFLHSIVFARGSAQPEDTLLFRFFAEETRQNLTWKQVSNVGYSILHNLLQSSLLVEVQSCVDVAVVDLNPYLHEVVEIRTQGW